MLNKLQDAISSNFTLDFENIKEKKYLAIPNRYNIRWLIPESPDYSITALKQWQPYSLKGIFAWHLILLLYRFNLLRVFCPNLTLKIPEGIDVVFYVGTPGKKRKLVGILISKNSGEIAEIRKLPLVEYAKLSLTRESQVLNEINQISPNAAPTFISYDESRGLLRQTATIGKPTGRKLTQAHIEFLYSLPQSNKTTSIAQEKFFLQSKLNTLYSVPCEIKRIIKSLINYLKSKAKLNRIWNHGDFAPWNLKIQNSGILKAIDWEDAQRNGMPLQDLIHFVFIQAYLFNDKPSFNKVLNNPNFRNYCHHFEIDFETSCQLIVYYALSTFLKDPYGHNNDYGIFCVIQADKFIDQ